MENEIGRVVRCLLRGDNVKATKFITPTLVVKATRKLYGGRIDLRSKTIDIVLTIGVPNYAERKFIEACQRLDEPFPVKKIQLKPYLKASRKEK